MAALRNSTRPTDRNGSGRPVTGKIGPNTERALRLLLALFGGYAFTVGFIAFIGAGLPHLGAPKSESVILSAMLGLIVYLGVIIWAIACVKPLRAAICILCGAGAMIGFAPLMAVE